MAKQRSMPRTDEQQKHKNVLEIPWSVMAKALLNILGNILGSIGSELGSLLGKASGDKAGGLAIKPIVSLRQTLLKGLGNTVMASMATVKIIIFSVAPSVRNDRATDGFGTGEDSAKGGKNVRILSNIKIFLSLILKNPKDSARDTIGILKLLQKLKDILKILRLLEVTRLLLLNRHPHLMTRFQRDS
ncbi:hypothetical protein X943_000074 [Babesia divergens]|uniref:Uncharacterized protein n=1 Tax=Babesia divergens TaxID=32595 RepID=A0AAD9G8K3_BABDI|nr:hypothetical protein X943_000074 [Babesia divergens]